MTAWGMGTQEALSHTAKYAIAYLITTFLPPSLQMLPTAARRKQDSNGVVHHHFQQVSRIAMGLSTTTSNRYRKK